MKSPKEARPKSTPRTVTLEGGFKITAPMATGRKTPTTKTAATIYPPKGY